MSQIQNPFKVAKMCQVNMGGHVVHGITWINDCDITRASEWMKCVEGMQSGLSKRKRMWLKRQKAKEIKRK